MTVITITTDFGDSLFSAIMEAVILSHNPNAIISIISNNIRKFDINQAKFFLENTFSYYPNGTIHLCVVDPGVGSNRKGLIIESDKYFFVGPDNGVFSFLNISSIKNVFKITYNPKNCSYTFHGRDIFAPVAARISLKENILNFAQPVQLENCFTFQTNNYSHPQFKVVYIDDFGNIFLDIKYEQFKRITQNKPFKLIFKNKIFDKLYKFYYEVEEGELLLLVNSLGYLEIAVREGNAKNVLKAKVGDSYEIKINES